VSGTEKALAARLAGLPYFQRTAPPSIEDDYVAFDLATAAGANEARARFAISADPTGERNVMFVHRDVATSTRALLVEFRGSDNVIVLNRDSLHGWIKFEGDGNVLVSLGDSGHLAVGATLYSRDTLVIGRRVVAWGIRIWVQGGTLCTIDDDCLLSESIQIRTTDHHSIIDLATWTQTNAPSDVTIGRHVWVGANCIVTKGANIGEGSIIAPAALVSGSIPDKELWGGVPARKIRGNVSWVGSHPVADPADIARLRELFA
jgi:acetyltransferase-like isoleucine patch superfamily enzyme